MHLLIISLAPVFVIALSQQGQAFYNAFLVAGFTEELFKFLALYLLIWADKNFNERFDGIVYAVFISLGFAAVENVMYVTQLGVQTGYIRAIVSVPAHALFGIAMGYYFGLAKFYPNKRRRYMFRAFVYPVLLHGVFDFILMLQDYLLLLGFIPYVIFLYVSGLKRMRNLSRDSFMGDWNA
jgi:RsiW-degrading membrane proteinase PrsW (M82 family)